MQQNTDAKDVRKRFRANLYPLEIGNTLGLSPTLFNTDPSQSLPTPDEMAGQLGRNIILAAERPNLGIMPTRNLPPATRQSIPAPKPVQDVPVRQGLTGRPAPRPSVPPARLTAPAAQPPERSFFDIAGRFHDFQAGPKIKRPNALEEFVPVVGPAWDAAADLQDGHYGSAALNAAFAVGDLMPVGYGIKALRNALKIKRLTGTYFPTARALRNAMSGLGMITSAEDLHHIAQLKGFSRYLPTWKNLSFVTKALPNEIHPRLHHKLGGLPKFGPMDRLWHGTNETMKGFAVGMASQSLDNIENVYRRFLAPSEPIPRKSKPFR